MNPISTELWRKPETVLISKFPSSCHAPIRKGLQIMKGELPDDSEELATNEVKESENTFFSAAEMNILREKLGANLVHGDYSLSELKQILQEEESSNGHSTKRRGR